MDQRIQAFDDIDDLFAAVDQGVQKAMANTLPRQNEITYGDYWMRVWEDIAIFGYISTREELDAEEIRLGATEEELAWEHESMDYSYGRGFRFGRAYSVIEPRGELGDTHVSVMVPITKEEFEQARAVDWQLEEIMKQDWPQKAVERLF
jgi:hypothetical protein